MPTASGKVSHPGISCLRRREGFHNRGFDADAVGKVFRHLDFVLDAKGRLSSCLEVTCLQENANKSVFCVLYGMDANIKRSFSELLELVKKLPGEQKIKLSKELERDVIEMEFMKCALVPHSKIFGILCFLTYFN